MRTRPRQRPRLPDAIQRRRIEHSPHTAPKHPSSFRIEMFSDGVMAIIITIMVLELELPELAEDFTGADLRAAVQHLAPKLLAYVMSFLIIAIFWFNHHNFFHSLRNSDAKIVWMNVFLLFWVSLIPLATAFLGAHPTTPAAAMVMGFVLMMCALCFPLMSYYAIYTGHLTHDDVPMELRRRTFRQTLPGFILYFISIVLAPVSVWCSWVIFFLVPIYYFLPPRVSDYLLNIRSADKS